MEALVNETGRCLNCGRTENEAPLVVLRYAGAPAWICPQCLPILIHHPEKLVDKLPGAADIGAAPADHD